MHTYDSVFFDYIERGSIRSSAHFLPHIVNLLDVNSVLDVGCGRGAWLKTWVELGVSDVKGVDGDYVNTTDLLFAPTCFQAEDISKEFDLGRQYGLVQCLEVAEHIASNHSHTLIGNLCRHSEVVLFSAAPPGQGGEFHVNERAYEYWRGLFKEEGYLAYDPIRETVINNNEILCWYRYNTFIFVKSGASIKESLASTLVGDSVPLQDVSPLTYKIRKKLIALLPVRFSTTLAVIKKHCIKLSLKWTPDHRV